MLLSVTNIYYQFNMADPNLEPEVQFNYAAQLYELARIQFSILSKDPAAFTGKRAEYDPEKGRILINSITLKDRNVSDSDGFTEEVIKDWVEMAPDGTISIVQESTQYEVNKEEDDDDDNDDESELNKTDEATSAFDDIIIEMQSKRVTLKTYRTIVLDPDIIDQGIVKQIITTDYCDGAEPKKVENDIKSDSKEFTGILIHWFNFYSSLQYNIGQAARSNEIDTFLRDTQIVHDIASFAFESIKNKIDSGWLSEPEHKLELSADLVFTESNVVPVIVYLQTYNAYDPTTDELICVKNSFSVPVDKGTIHSINRSDETEGIMKMFELKKDLDAYLGNLKLQMSSAAIQSTIERYTDPNKISDTDEQFIGESSTLVIPNISDTHLPGINYTFRLDQRYLDSSGYVRYKYSKTEFDTPTPEQLLFLISLIRPPVR